MGCGSSKARVSSMETGTQNFNKESEKDKNNILIDDPAEKVKHRQNKINDIEKLRNLLLSTEPNSVSSTEKQIANKYLTNVSQIKSLIRNLISMTVIRPEKLDVYIELVNILNNRYQLFNETLIQMFVRHVFDGPVRYNLKEDANYLYFYFKLMKSEVIKRDFIIKQFKSLLNKEDVRNNASGIMFIPKAFFFFSPEISENDKDLFENIRKMLHKENDVSIDEILELRENEFVKSSILYFIKKDDITALQRIVANNPDFSPYSTIKFDRKDFFTFRHRKFKYTKNGKKEFYKLFDSFLALAAFYGSVKIVEYFVASSQFDVNAHSTATVAAAVAGGNEEILRILNEKGFCFDGSIEIAKLFQRKQIEKWIDENIEKSRLDDRANFDVENINNNVYYHDDNHKSNKFSKKLRFWSISNATELFSENSGFESDQNDENTEHKRDLTKLIIEDDNLDLFLKYFTISESKNESENIFNCENIDICIKYKAFDILEEIILNYLSINEIAKIEIPLVKCSALHVANYINSYEVCAKILKIGNDTISLNDESYNGLTPLMIARKNKNEKIIKLLQKDKRFSKEKEKKTLNKNNLKEEDFPDLFEKVGYLYFRENGEYPIRLFFYAPSVDRAEMTRFCFAKMNFYDKRKIEWNKKEIAEIDFDNLNPGDFLDVYY